MSMSAPEFFELQMKTDKKTSNVRRQRMQQAWLELSQKAKDRVESMESLRRAYLQSFKYNKSVFVDIDGKRLEDVGAAFKNACTAFSGVQMNLTLYRKLLETEFTDNKDLLDHTETTAHTYYKMTNMNTNIQQWNKLYKIDLDLDATPKKIDLDATPTSQQQQQQQPQTQQPPQRKRMIEKARLLEDVTRNTYHQRIQWTRVASLPQYANWTAEQLRQKHRTFTKNKE